MPNLLSYPPPGSSVSADYFDPKNHHSSPHCISNKHIQFSSASGALIRCTLGQRTWTWNIKRVVSGFGSNFTGGALNFSRAWVLDTCGTIKTAEGRERCALALYAKYLPIARNIKWINRIVAEKNKMTKEKCWIKICAFILKIFSLGNFDLYERLKYRELIDYQRNPLRNFKDALFNRERLGMAPSDVSKHLKFTDRVPVNEDQSKMLEDALNLYVENGGQVTDYFDILGRPGLTMDELYRVDPHPSRRGFVGYVDLPDVDFHGQNFLHGYRLDVGLTPYPELKPTLNKDPD